MASPRQFGLWRLSRFTEAGGISHDHTWDGQSEWTSFDDGHRHQVVNGQIQMADGHTHQRLSRLSGER